ncbi:MAG: PhoX family phosphatase [Limnobacter sp.]|nr:PhoX family phosphatase [Limnobacter sp.]
MLKRGFQKPVNLNSDDKENNPSNQSGNRPFAAVLQANMKRRTLLQGSLAVAASSFITPMALAAGKNGAGAASSSGQSGSLVGFKPLTIAQATLNSKIPSISEDYEYQVLIPWGTPLQPGLTQEYAGNPATRPTAAQAARQIGIGHDGMWFFPMNGQYRKGNQPNPRGLNNHKGMLCINHEYGGNSHVLGKSMPESLEDVRLSQNVHGVSVVAIEKASRFGPWQVVSSKSSRRITVNTPVEFSGPVAGSALLENAAGNIPMGTVNNCGSGPTPWGTYLTCEENFNGYFGATEGASFNDRRTEDQLRYGIDFDGFNYGWEFFDKRFDLSNPDFANEYRRFGWVVEIDPYDASVKPVKRTALGRFKHEAIAIAESENGRIAAYMGDDQRFDYCYKFVSDQPWKQAIDSGQSPLDEGSLYVARFDDNGTGQWLELTINNPLLAARFSSQAEVLTFARLAADILGATPMDRPEWTTIGKDGEVYWTLTNNTARTLADAANPEAPNSDGHIIKMQGDHLSTRFEWAIFILASSTRGTENVFTDPDAAWADPFGRLFIGTDGGQPDGLQDQLVVFDTTAENPQPKRLLCGVNSDEITGFTVTPDYRTAFINIQHPGDGDPSRTNFPAQTDGVTIPRDCTLVITKKDGGVIGS